MKKCSNCNKNKEDSEYYTKKRSKVRVDGTIYSWVGLYAKCKKCHDAHTKKNSHLYKDWYANYRKENKEKISIKTKEWYVQTKAEWWRIISTFVDLKCSSCGYDKHTAALEFHHVDPLTKSTTIHKIVKDSCPNEDTIKVLKAEIDKCVVLCANCHREEHAKYNFIEKATQAYRSTQ